MKLFRENKKEKSWAIQLIQCHDTRVDLIAVDAESGDWVATLIVFQNGFIIPTSNTDTVLRNKGYDPHEHTNFFNEKGQIIISYGEGEL